MSGDRHNRGKRRFSLLPWDAIRTTVDVLEMGARKYGDRNWEQGFETWSIPYDCLHRHLDSWWAGERLDPESGLPHLAHVACNALMLLAHELRGIGRDDRPRVPVADEPRSDETRLVSGSE